MPNTYRKFLKDDPAEPKRGRRTGPSARNRSLESKNVRTCQNCRGTGKKNGKTCSACDGVGGKDLGTL